MGSGLIHCVGPFSPSRPDGIRMNQRLGPRGPRDWDGCDGAALCARGPMRNAAPCLSPLSEWAPRRTCGLREARACWAPGSWGAFLLPPRKGCCKREGNGCGVQVPLAKLTDLSLHTALLRIPSVTVWSSRPLPCPLPFPAVRGEQRRCQDCPGRLHVTWTRFGTDR